MKAAIYARVSTQRQKEEGSSLDTQVEAAMAFATAHGCTVSSQHIIREDWPGSTLERPALTRLREMVRRREFDQVIAYSTDRLARNP
ncbi:MAG: recombinase family protein, partial [Chloroflexi bacterium]|nr:recombinase family protein [Chloroflexota bacterium]